jgi:hypothetical protein
MADSTIIMPHSGKVVAGEIMAGDAFAGARRERPHDIVDAEYETVARTAHAIPPVQAPVNDKPGMDLLRDAAPAGSARGGVGFWGAGVLAAVAAFWMAGGHTLSRYLPFSGADGGTVRVASLASRVAETAAGPRLFIDGAVENTALTSTPAPDLSIQVTGRDGAVTRYRIAATGQTIASGAAWKFSSRIDAPHAGVRSVSVIIAEEKRGS